MLRRSFCRAVVGVLVAPGFAIAQPLNGVRRIGRLESGAPLTPEDIRIETDALRDLGWVEGQNLHTESRYANGRFEALQPLAEELVRTKVEVIVTSGTTATKAAMRATKTIPIVFRIADSPVGRGLVASLAHPGGNVTGFSAALQKSTPSTCRRDDRLWPIRNFHLSDTNGRCTTHSGHRSVNGRCRS
jgi:putative tryptophan/tyrosine transport system substrate-binding protein